MVPRKAIVAGATGVVGRYILAHLVRSGDWPLVAVSRRRPDIAGDYEHIAIDLLDGAQARARLSGLDDITHVFFAAIERADPAALVADNLALLRNFLDALESAAASLEYVHRVHGSKWYGSHLGPYRTPAREADPRHMPPNFYYDQQDYLSARQAGQRWT